MVIKIDERDGLRFFDNCDNVKVRFDERCSGIFNEKMINDVVGCSTDDVIRSIQLYHLGKETIGVWVLTFTRQGKIYEYVHCSSTIYLLNDNGKTIEKL